MSYRQELQVLVDELREKSRAIAPASAEDREKWWRQAEVLDFLINHPQDAMGALDA